MHELALLLASKGAGSRERWKELFLDAFQASSHEEAPVTRLLEELRTLTEEERKAFGVPKDASATELYGYLMREGAALLYLLER